ncbi:ATP-binding protein [Sphingobium nicotianae]|uniref:histidine kinase n=1 Tax=Sphingobium nicotianae TaxID=2782607 RepID=A0A9X1DEB0_9SPHN|nr:ATP-binding protein [Sphingobium nicotianae]MBT2188329.1 HAMP domain-containing protein [Sphingobium nicotianae]
MRFRSFGLLGRILLILAFVLATEFLANTWLFERTSQFALQDDDAHRMAEYLVIVRRVIDKAPPADRPRLTRELSTARFRVDWYLHPDTSTASYRLNSLRSQILEREPELLDSKLRLHLMPLSQGGDIAGSLELADHSTVAFRTSQAKMVWPLTFGRIFGLIAPTLVLVLIGAFMVRATLKPLKVLMRATKKVGTREPQPVPEEGPGEVRNLIHDFNLMQTRIHKLLATRTRALAAVGHDLRTPLSRLKLRLGNVALDPETQKAMGDDIDEMGDLLRSLQIYLGGEGQELPPEKVDLAVMASTLIDAARDMGHDAYLHAPSSLQICVRPVAIRRSLANLIDNAIHYGGNVRLSILPEEEEVLICVDDDGPGIPEHQMTEVLQPFVRLDGARSRNTSGMGLGLAIVNDAVHAEGGTLELTNRPEGGLRVVIRLPRQRA